MDLNARINGLSKLNIGASRRNKMHKIAFSERNNR